MTTTISTSTTSKSTTSMASSSMRWTSDYLYTRLVELRSYPPGKTETAIAVSQCERIEERLREISDLHSKVLASTANSHGLKTTSWTRLNRWFYQESKIILNHLVQIRTIHRRSAEFHPGTDDAGIRSASIRYLEHKLASLEAKDFVPRPLQSADSGIISIDDDTFFDPDQAWVTSPNPTRKIK